MREFSHSTEHSKPVQRPSGSLPPIHRIKSNTSVISSKQQDEMGKPDTKFAMVPIRDAAEMKKRASTNKTFIRVIFGPTSIVLSYKVCALTNRCSDADE